MLKDNIKDIENKIKAACERAGRDPSEVTLIAVSKTKPTALVLEAYDAGMIHFGENKVQELSQKYDELSQILGKKIYWHQIGHLQRNKVKYIVDKVILIHSVDSLRLAEQIEAEAAKKNVLSDILIEVNVAGEESKDGVDPNELLTLVEDISKFPHIRIRGLMTVAPYCINPENNREYFKNLRDLYIDIKSKNIDNDDKEKKWDKYKHISDNINLENNFKNYFNILSMGMTGDFEIAIEEGATMVRVGTGIFGQRNYSTSK
ncbi:MAG: YggS family pyridoxal phosphate-dependent enzyme [Clostridiales bacterium]|nr:YggS family pyridoxal phosphate-dependent enzyme [Clostridiales bacterium]